MKSSNHVLPANLSMIELTKICLIIGCGYVLSQVIFTKIEIVVSPSVEYRIFIKNVGVIAKDAYARFSISNPLLPQGSTSITKRFGCMPGETMETIERSHFCNGRYLDTAKSYSIKGEPLPLFIFNGPIPDGVAYMSGRHPDSFDSRYWGFLDLSRLDIIPMKPLL